jgi:glycosyltransferase involved in cell wall biosynthesis
MKVLLISHFFPPLSIGGAEKIAQVYAINLQERGYQVQVLCVGEWITGQQHWNGYIDEIYQGIPVRRVNLNWVKAENPNRSLYDNLLIEDNFTVWLEEWQPDVVHVVSLMTLSASVVRVAKRLNIPVVFTMVDFWLVCPKVNLVRGDESLCDGKVTSSECLECMMWDSRIYKTFRRFCSEETTLAALQYISQIPKINRVRGFRGKVIDIDERRRVMAELVGQVDSIVAPSAFLKKIATEAGLPLGSVSLIHYGHNLSWVKRMPQKTPSKSLRIGYIGQIIPIKGLHLLIQAFQAAYRAAAVLGNQADLQIYGAQDKLLDYTESLKAMIDDDDPIRFMGSYQHDQIGDVFSGLDVIVVPSQWHENNPLVVHEAFASKTPVIASNVGGIAEFIEHDVNGLLFQYNRVEDLCTQLKRVISEPDLVRRLQNGIKPVKTISEEMQEYLAIYQNLIDQQRESNP